MHLCNAHFYLPLTPNPVPEQGDNIFTPRA